jgi:tetratricopeptide (TPR) repeat protein
MPLLTPKEHANAHSEVRKLFAALQTHSEVFGPHHPRTLEVVHSLAIALSQSGNIHGAVDLLHQALDSLNSSLGKDHPARVDVLHTLGQITLEQGELEQAAAIFREALECDTRHAGPNHPSSLEAKGDLAAVLFELGQNDEAESLEIEACQSARQHLGLFHLVTTALSWNRALSFERRGDFESARGLFINELSWLLLEDAGGMDPGQNVIRAMLAERLHWDAAPAC